MLKTPHFLEPLESRIAPAGVYTFGTEDGDMVTVYSSKGNNAQIQTATGLTASPDIHIYSMDLSPAIFEGTDIRITVTRGPHGDGLINVGHIGGGTHRLRNISIQGDLGDIDVGNDSAAGLTLKSLTVRTLGRYGASTGAADFTSTINGSLGAFKVGGDMKDAYLHVIGTHGTLGSVLVGGSLIGDGVATGIIDSNLSMGPVQIGGDVQGGTGNSSGAIQSDTGKIVSVTIGGSLIGGTGQFTGEIRSSLGLGPLKIGGNVQGGSGANSGFIATYTGLGGLDTGNMPSITIDGSVLGGAGKESGLIRSTGSVGVIKIAHDLRAGAGDESGKIDVVGDLTSVSIGGSVVGGAGRQDSYVTGYAHVGQIYAHGNITRLKISGDLQGGAGALSGAISSSARIAMANIGGSILGGTGNSSGLLGGLNFGTVRIGHDILGGLGPGAGRLSAGDGLTSLSIGGSVMGGAQLQSGMVFVLNALKTARIGGDLVGGTAKNTGYLSAGNLGSITVVGSVIGSGYSVTGGIDVNSGIGSVKIGHDLVGGSISGSAENVSSSGYIRALNARIGSIVIGGSIISGIDTSTGGNLFFSGGIQAQRDIGSIAVQGSLIGHGDTGSGASPVLITARGQEAPTATKDLAIGKLSVGKRVERASILAGYDGVSFTNSQAQIGSVTIGGDFIASNVVAGIKDVNGNGFGNDDDQQGSAGTIARIASVTIGGTLFGTNETTADHYGVVAATISALKVGGHVYANPSAFSLRFSESTIGDIVIRALGSN